MTKPKIVAMYLPQYHQIPENDEFWGKGFTDWVTVKNAKPLFEGHLQPKVPLNRSYYDLSNKESVEWQARLAKEYGIYGFGVYHYWFNNEKNLLTKPAEIMRDCKTLGIKYFFAWDNGSWKRSWSNVPGNDWAPIVDSNIQNNTKQKILIPYILGGEKEWENHYNYVKVHFLSPNYEKLDNKPVFCIFSYSEEMKKMCNFWDKLAQKDGFDGIFFIMRYDMNSHIPDKYSRYLYEPHYAAWSGMSIKRIVHKLLKIIHLDILNNITIYDYDKVWKNLLKISIGSNSNNIIYGAFVDYDDSPRRGSIRSKIFKGASPEKFKNYMKELMDISSEQGKEYIFLTAWNEWGEGAYLEPDEINGYNYLKAIKEVCNES